MGDALASTDDAPNHHQPNNHQPNNHQPSSFDDDDTNTHPRTMPQLGLSAEALQQLLEVASHLALFTDTEGWWGGDGVDPTRPRPASRKAVKNMRRIRLTEEALVKLGHARMECPVCMEGYVCG